MAVKLVLIRDIGLEIETSVCTENAMGVYLGRIPLKLPWRAVHDGSTKHTALHNQSLPGKYSSVPESISGSFRNYDFGVEFVSPIINTERSEWLEDIKNIERALWEKDQEFLDMKCSIHTHVNMTGAPTYVLQNLITIWNKLEAFIYRISVAEAGVHRGLLRRNMLYSRPMGRPQVVVNYKTGQLTPCFDYNCLLSARTIEEFFQALGNTSTDRDPAKYNPVRYMGLNFFNFISMGTVEFRTPNITPNWRNIVAWVKLFQAICKASFGKGWSEYPDLPLGSKPDNFDYSKFFQILELDPETIVTLTALYNQSSWVDYTPDWVFTHLDQESAKYINFGGVPSRLVPPSIEGQEVIWYPNKHSDEYSIVTTGAEIMNNRPLLNKKAAQFKMPKPIEMNPPEPNPEPNFLEDRDVEMAKIRNILDVNADQFQRKNPDFRNVRWEEPAKEAVAPKRKKKPMGDENV